MPAEFFPLSVVRIHRALPFSVITVCGVNIVVFPCMG